MHMNTQQDYKAANKFSDSMIIDVLTLSVSKSILLENSEDFLLYYEHTTFTNRKIFTQNKRMGLTNKVSRMYYYFCSVFFILSR